MIIPPIDESEPMAEAQFAEELFDGDKPRIYRSGGLRGFRSESDFCDTPANYLSIPNAKVIVSDREIIYMTEKWEYIPWLYPKPWPYARYLVPSTRSIKMDVKGLPTRRLSGSVFMPYIVAGNWFHTLFDNYARLYFLDAMELSMRPPVGEPFWAATRRTPVPSDRALVHATFMQGAKNLRLKKGIYEIERLIAPPLANQDDYFYDKPVQFVSERLRQLSPGKNFHHPLRLFISRSDINVRNLINEDELTVALRRLGFTILCPGDISFPAQLELFAAAEIIVGVHGQGFTPMISARNCRLLLEFEAYNWNFTSYRSLAHVLNIPYRKLPCEMVEHRNPGRFDWLAKVHVGNCVTEIERAIREIESSDSLASRQVGKPSAPPLGSC